MNIQNLMMQARKLQGDIEKITKEIENKEFFYESENISIKMNGKYKVTNYTIKNEEIINDKELLEDVTIVAINDVLEQIKKEKDQKLGKYTNGMNGLF